MDKVIYSLNGHTFLINRTSKAYLLRDEDLPKSHITFFAEAVEGEHVSRKHECTFSILGTLEDPTEAVEQVLNVHPTNRPPSKIALNFPATKIEVKNEKNEFTVTFPEGRNREIMNINDKGEAKFRVGVTFKKCIS